MSNKKIIAMLLLLAIMINLTCVIKTYAAGEQKIITEPVKKAAIKSMSFVIENRAKKTVEKMVEHKVADDVAEKYVKKESYLLIRNGADKKVYSVKEYQALSDAEKARLQKAIERNVNKEFFGKETFDLKDEVIDFFTDYKLWAAGTTLLVATLSGSVKELFDKITMDSLIDADLLEPAYLSTINDSYYTKKWGEQGYWIMPDEYSTEIPSENGSFVFEGTASYFAKGFEIPPTGIEGKELLNNTLALDLSYNGNLGGKGFLRTKLTNGTGSISDLDIQIDNTSLDLSFGLRPYKHKFFKNGQLMISKDSTVSLFSVPQEADFTNFWKTLKRVTVGILKQGNRTVVITEMKNNQDNLRLETYYDYEMTSLIFNKIYSSRMTFTDSDDSGITKQIKYNWRLLTDVTPSIIPEPKVEEVPIRKGDFERTTKDGKEVVLIPNITTVPMTDKTTKEVVTPEIQPDGTVTIKNPKTGETVPDSNVEVGNPVGNTDPDKPVTIKPDPNSTTDPIPIDDATSNEPIPDPPSDGDTGTPPDNGTPPEENPDDVHWDKLKGLGIAFTDKFPFSLPWDIYYAAKEFDIPAKKLSIDKVWTVGGVDIPIKIEIPDWIDKYTPMIRMGFIAIFVIGLIYGVRNLMGGSV